MIRYQAQDHSQTGKKRIPRSYCLFSSPSFISLRGNKHFLMDERGGMVPSQAIGHELALQGNGKLRIFLPDNSPFGQRSRYPPQFAEEEPSCFSSRGMLYHLWTYVRACGTSSGEKPSERLCSCLSSDLSPRARRRMDRSGMPLC